MAIANKAASSRYSMDNGYNTFCGIEIKICRQMLLRYESKVVNNYANIIEIIHSAQERDTVL